MGISSLNLEKNMQKIGLFCSSVLLSPTKIIVKTYDGLYRNEAIFVFIAVAILTFLKSFFRPNVGITFFENQTLNRVLFLINIPQVRWLVAYVSFFIFIYLLCSIVRRFSNHKLQYRSFIIPFLALSVYGIAFHIIFAVVNMINIIDRMWVYVNLLFVWMSFLYIFTINHISKFSVFASIVIFVLSSLPAFILVGFTGVFPYMIWVSS